MDSGTKQRNTPEIYIISSVPPDVTVVGKKSFCHINKEMLWFKLHFFLYLGGLGAALPYMVIFAKERIGISASSLGAVLTSQMFLFIFSKPFAGYVADYFNKLKATICALTVTSAVCYFVMLAVPSYEHHLTATYKKGPPAYRPELCDLLLNKSEETDEFSELQLTANQLWIQEFSICCCNNSFEIPKEYTKISALHSETSKNDDDGKDTFKNNQHSLLFFNDSHSIDFIVCRNDSEDQHHFSFTSKRWTVNLCSSYKTNKIQDTNPPYNCSSNHKNICFRLLQKMDNKLINQEDGVVSDEVIDFKTYQFWIFSLLFIIGSICCNAIFTLSDTACFETLQKTGADFGQQRLFGAIGWGLVAPLAGFINDNTKDFYASWILMGVMLALFLLNISKLDLVKPHFSKNILKDVGTVFKSIEFLTFEVTVLVNGVGTGIIWFYLIWFLKSIGGSDLLYGLSLAVQSFLGVIPLMFFSGWIIRKVGHYNVLTMSLMLYAIRFLWYSYLQNPWFVLVVEWAHGITYGLYYTTLASYAKMSAKPGTEATTQAVIFSTHEGLGAGIGCVLCGLGFDYVGSHQTFFYCGMFFASCMFASLVFGFFIRKRKGDIDVTSMSKK